VRLALTYTVYVAQNRTAKKYNLVRQIESWRANAAFVSETIPWSSRIASQL